jgi:hypothetical protein
MNANLTKHQRRINDKKQKKEEKSMRNSKQTFNGSEVYSNYIERFGSNCLDRRSSYTVDAKPYRQKFYAEMIKFYKNNNSKKLTAEETEFFESIVNSEDFESVYQQTTLYYYDEMMSKELCQTFTDSSKQYGIVVSNGNEGIDDGIYFVDSIEYEKVNELYLKEFINAANGGFRIIFGNTEFIDNKAIMDDVYRRQLKKTTKLYLSCEDFIDKVEKNGFKKEVLLWYAIQ